MALSQQNTSRQPKPRIERVLAFDDINEVTRAHDTLKKYHITTRISQGLFMWFICDIATGQHLRIYQILEWHKIPFHKHTWTHRPIKKGDKDESMLNARKSF